MFECTETNNIEYIYHGTKYMAVKKMCDLCVKLIEESIE